ncbi:MAG: (Fe-S)-binding protein [Candidatus Lokiarchaeota archaeon]|nr:(Fe-S)-binding protein [Candidatus Lokiarchaeota archaeon]
MLDEKLLLNQVQSCIECGLCLDFCDTFQVTQDEFKSPRGRLKIAGKIFSGQEVSNEEIIGIYTCTLCAACDLKCQQEIEISEIVHATKVKLVSKKLGPLPNHEKIIQGIVDAGNSVGGIAEERLNWLSEDYKKQESFEEKESDTLLFLGCMSSFRVQESALAPYIILRNANYDFKILKKEPCCGEYIYSTGKIELSKQLFKENIDLFRRIGVKNLIVTCGGCLYAFDTVYRKYFKDFDIKVRHVVDVIYELEKEGKIELKSLNKSITYHDPCRLGRKYKNGPLYHEAREILKKCGVNVKEISENHDDCPCCGAGSGIRGVNSTLSINIGKKTLGNLKTEEIVSSCPLCIFNFRYANYKNSMDKLCKYITDYILEAFSE